MKRLAPFVLALALPGLLAVSAAQAADGSPAAMTQTEYNRLLDQKITELGKAIKADSKNAQAWDDRATAMRLRKRDATSDAAQATKLAPASAIYQYHYALALMGVYKADEAILAMNKAIKLQPSVARWVAYRSILETWRRKKPEAQADLDAARALDPSDPAVAKAAAAIALPPPPEATTLDAMNKPIPQLTLAMEGVGP